MTDIKHSKQILQMLLPGETSEVAIARIENDLATLPSLLLQWNELKAMDRETIEYVRKFRNFFGDFLHLWNLSSPMTIDVLSMEECYSILEFACSWKHHMWLPELLDSYERMPEKITIYRGAKGPTENLLKGYSWSLSEGFAETFAFNSGGIVVSATIARDDILLLGECEFEVIPRMNSLYEIQEVPRTTHPE